MDIFRKPGGTGPHRFRGIFLSILIKVVNMREKLRWKDLVKLFVNIGRSKVSVPMYFIPNVLLYSSSKALMESCHLRNERLINLSGNAVRNGMLHL